MIHEEDQLDDFLKNILKTGGTENPPSSDYTQKVMKKVEAIPVVRSRRESAWLIVIGIVVFLTIAITGTYFLINYWSVVQGFGIALLQKLPFAISWKAVAIGFIYLVLARILLALGILALINKSPLKLDLSV